MDSYEKHVVDIHLLDHMKPSSITGNFDTKTYYITNNTSNTSPVYIPELEQLMKLQAVRFYNISTDTTGKYLPGISYQLYQYYRRYGGYEFPITRVGNYTFAIPYFTPDHTIIGNGVVFEPEKTDIVWWYKNNIPFSSSYTYSMVLYNEPTDLYIFIETPYQYYSTDDNQRYFFMGPDIYALSSAKYNERPFDLRFNYDKSCIVTDRRPNDAPSYSLCPFFELTDIKRNKGPVLFDEQKEGHKGSSPQDWSMQILSDPSGAFHSFRSCNKLDPNNTTLIKPAN